MRKFGVVLAALTCLSLMAFPAHAAKGDFTFGLNGGMTIPTGDFGKNAKSGPFGGVFGDYQFHSMLAVGVDAFYTQNKGKDLPASVTDAKVTIMEFGAHVKAMPEMKDVKFTPYLQVGAGFYNVKAEDTEDNVSYSATKSKFGFNVGAGVDYPVTPQVGVGVFGSWHDVMDAYDFGNETKAANAVLVGLKVTFATTGAKK